MGESVALLYEESIITVSFIPLKTVILPAGRENFFSRVEIALSILTFLVVAAAIASAVILKRRKNIVIKETLAVTSKQEKTVYQTLDKETIFVLRPNLRDDDKELISFIVDNGGQAYESELRKKFLQPRTTMWRAVKRLEREGIVEIEKKESQNLVKLKDSITGEGQ